MMHKRRNQHGKNESQLNGELIWQRMMPLPEGIIQELFHVRRRPLSGVRAGPGKASSHSPQLNTLISVFPAHFLAIGWTRPRSLLAKVCRKLSSIFNLGMFHSLSRIRRIRTLTAKVREQGRFSTGSSTERVWDWQNPNSSITQVLVDFSFTEIFG